MIYTEHKITLDIHKIASSAEVRVKKGDTARRLLIHLTQSGYPYHISKDCYAVFTAKKPDGNVVFNNCGIDDCEIIYDFTDQTVAAVGLAECEIILYGSDSKQITSAKFQIMVEDTIYDAETEIESTDEYNALADLIAKAQTVIGDGVQAPAIVCEAEGEVISVSDASEKALQGLRIFGKSTQDGTPTPESPVEIVSLAVPMIIVTDGTEDNVQNLTITTPDGLAGIPVSSGGNYTDGDGQQWICDEIDLTRGVYIQRIAKMDLSTLSTWARGTGNGWANASAFYSTNALSDAMAVEGYETIANILCNRLVVGTAAKIAGQTVNRVGQGTGTSLYVSIEGIETAENLVAYLAENETIVQYVLATPIETELTDAEIASFAALHTYKPYTTIYTDTGAYAAAEYVADTKTYVDNRSVGTSAVVVASVALPAANWTGSDHLYSQVVSIDGVTANSQINLAPSVEQLAIFYEKDLTFVTENDGGIVTVYVIGQKPENDYTIQANIVEVIV